MARMYPAQLDPTDHNIPRSERTVFDALRDQLDDQFVVFHSAAWLGRGQRGELNDGEADFVVAHPHWGWLVLEIKGGEIEYDARVARSNGRSQWFSTDYFGKRHQLKHDPFEQAKRSKITLQNKIGELEGWNNREFSRGHAVVFPDVCADLPVVPAQFDPAILIDGRDMGRLAQRIDGVYRAWRGGYDVKPLGNDGLALLIALLAPTFTMHSLLAARIGNDQARVLTLTKQQFSILNNLRRKRRALISGCAGSGKTALAVEKATRLARDEGMRVLLACYNARLADALRVQLGQIPNITVANFHQFAVQQARAAELDSQRPTTMSEDDYFSYHLPDLLLSAAEALPEQRFDALIVDEGQDFLPLWWDGLQAQLVPQPIMYIFYDDNQRLYSASDRFPIDDDPLFLSVNCRNTQTIHAIAWQFYKSLDADQITAEGPEGVAIELRHVATPTDEREVLAALLQQLIKQEKVDPQQIAILTRRSPRALGWADTTIGGVIVREQPRGKLQTLCCTIKSFKGMESPVVIIAGLGEGDEDEAEQDTALDALLYVACSRATSHLIVLLPRTAPRKLRRVFGN